MSRPDRPPRDSGVWLARRWPARRVGLAVVAAVAVLGLWATSDRHDPSPPAGPLGPPSANRASAEAQRAEGAYLLRLGNCLACHTAPGGAPGAGGRAIETPYGRVYSSNLTPHATGLGGWTADDFWAALHEGRSRDGRPLSPAFPYTAFTRLTRSDSDAIWAMLQTLPPVDRPAQAAELRWPMGETWALQLWRWLFFRPGVYAPRSDRDAAWNRGAYLVQGVAHCGECHAPRGWLSSPARGTALSGGQMGSAGWLAPALGGPGEAETLPQLLQTGRSARGSAAGPMAEVVMHGTQHLRPDDLAAITRYVTSLPSPASLSGHPQDGGEVPGGGRGHGASAVPASAGEALYDTHCAGCHGDDGAGEGLYSPLAGNRTVLLDEPGNLIRVIRHGGFAPNTQANPRPFGMPPFGHRLTQAEIAAVASHVRSAWGNRASPVSELQVLQTR